MDRFGDDFLADAALALDEHRDARTRGLGGDRQRGAELRRAADDLVEAQHGGELFGERAQLARGLAADRGLERGEEAFGSERLDEEVGGARAHRGDRGGDRAVGGEHEDRQLRPAAAQLGDQRGGAHLRRAVIEQHGVERHAVGRAERGDRGFGIAREHRPPAAAGSDRRDKAALRRLVVDQHEQALAVPSHSIPRIPFRVKDYDEFPNIRLRLISCS